MELKGRVALVTGGAGGIGGAVVRALAKGGVAGVAINYRKSSKEAEALAAEIERGGVKALAVQADVQSDAQVRAMMQTIEDRFGRLDVVVNNAGVTHWVKLADLEGLTDPIWDEILDVNVKGAFRCARAAQKLLEANQGMIVNVSSISGVLAPSTISSLAYGTAKAALIYMTKGLGRRDGAQGARQLRRAGVHRYAVDEPALRRRLPAGDCQSVGGLSAATHRDAGGYRRGDPRFDHRRGFCHRADSVGRRRFEFELKRRRLSIVISNEVRDLFGEISRRRLEMTTSIQDRKR